MAALLARPGKPAPIKIRYPAGAREDNATKMPIKVSGAVRPIAADVNLKAMAVR